MINKVILEEWERAEVENSKKSGKQNYLPM